MKLVYKIGNRLQDRTGLSISSKEFIKYFLDTAKANNSRLLYETDKNPSPLNRDNIDTLILVSSKGDFGLIGRVVETGSNFISKPNGYVSPDMFIKSKGFKRWFALDSIQEMPKGVLDENFVWRNGKSLLECLKSNAYMFYID